MKIIEPPKPWPDGFTLVQFAKDQPKYITMPALRERSGEVISCWHLSVWERCKLLFGGNLYLHLLTFNQAIQPQRLTLKVDA